MSRTPTSSNPSRNPRSIETPKAYPQAIDIYKLRGELGALARANGLAIANWQPHSRVLKEGTDKPSMEDISQRGAIRRNDDSITAHDGELPLPQAQRRRCHMKQTLDEGRHLGLLFIFKWVRSMERYRMANLHWQDRSECRIIKYLKGNIDL